MSAYVVKVCEQVGVVKVCVAQVSLLVDVAEV